MSQPGKEKRKRKPFTYYHGTPDREGWWYIWPDDGVYFVNPVKPRVCLVTKGDGILDFNQDTLFIKSFPDPGHQKEAHLFKGRIAGPLPEAIV